MQYFTFTLNLLLPFTPPNYGNEIMVIKILLVSPFPPPSGGIATWSKTVLEVVSDYSEIEVIHIDTGVRWRSTNDLAFFKRLFGGTFQAFLYILRIFNAIKDTSPHLVHLCTSASLATAKDIIILSLCSVLGVKSVIHYHFGRLPEIIKGNTWEWKLIRVAMKLADIILLLDRKSQIAVKDKLPDNFVKLIANPIDLKMLKERFTRRESEISPNKLSRFVYAGHIVPNKGIHELVEACALIKEYPFQLHLVGPVEDSFREKLESLAGKLNAGQWLRFHGMMTRQEAMGFINDADIFVLPSYTEGFPNVILEAMAFGKAIIATRVGAIPEMLDDKTAFPCGLLINSQNVEELHNALVYFIENPREASLCGALAHKKALEQYSMEKIMEQYVALWLSISGKI